MKNGELFGVYQASHGPIAAYAKWNEHHGGYVLYNARTGRALCEPHKTLELLTHHEPFKPNPPEKVQVQDGGVIGQELPAR